MGKIDKKFELCSICRTSIEMAVFEYSMKKFKVPLCITHQRSFGKVRGTATQEAIDLYEALKKRGVPAELEKYVGGMTVDIAIPEAMVNIEVDGIHHNADPRTALQDLKRTFHAFRKGYLTLRIPNSLVKFSLDETAQFITDFLNESLDQLEDELY